MKLENYHDVHSIMIIMITVLHDHDGHDSNNLDKDDVLTYYNISRHSVGIKIMLDGCD